MCANLGCYWKGIQVISTSSSRLICYQEGRDRIGDPQLRYFTVVARLQLHNMSKGHLRCRLAASTIPFGLIYLA